MTTFLVKDRIRESSVTRGTDPFELAGAWPGAFLAFGDRFSNGELTYYCAVNIGMNEWEAGIGTYVASTNLLMRTAVLDSSNDGDPVLFSAGTKEVFCTYPADKAVIERPEGVVVLYTPTTVASLPTATTDIYGAVAYVTDAAAPVQDEPVVGGGSNKIPVHCNGLAWLPFGAGGAWGSISGDIADQTDLTALVNEVDIIQVQVFS
jgi:hypothetical protein